MAFGLFQISLILGSLLATSNDVLPGSVARRNVSLAIDKHVPVSVFQRLFEISRCSHVGIEAGALQNRLLLG